MIEPKGIEYNDVNFQIFDCTIKFNCIAQYNSYLDSSVSGKKKMSTTRTMPPIMAASSEGSMNGKRPKNPSSEKTLGYRTAGFAK